jgi:hypothetical protein
MSKPLRSTLVALLGLAAIAAAPPPIAPDKAQGVFDEAKVISDRDGGRLWGIALYGPMLLVEPQSRFVTANRADPDGVLTATGAVFTGELPTSENISNSPMRWSGTLWTEMMWPLPTDEATRRVEIAHELFHRIQPDLGFPKREAGDNAHLDTLEGRYLLQLEWRALARAMAATSSAQRRQAVADALLFRADRYRLFPKAVDDENALELMEGVAEYTGVRLGLTTARARTAYAIKDLSSHIGEKTFVRSFAYATGPAYGLLLDRYDPTWRSTIKTGPRLDRLLQRAMRIRLPTDLEAAAKRRAAKYDDGTLRAFEVKRDVERQARLAAYKANFVEGPVLNIRLKHMNVQFNPSTLQPLDGYGVVYPTLRITDAWGALEVSDGALLHKGWDMVTVSAVHAAPSGLEGDGWVLKLKPGWTVGPGARKGDLEVVAVKTTP